MNKPTALLLLSFSLSLSSGCSTGTGGLVTGKGRVTLDGEPVAGANVVFFPAGEETLQADAITDADGRFSLTTRDGQGVRPGDYKVIVTKLESQAVDEATHKSATGVDDFPGKAKMESAGKARSLLPDLYGSLPTTPLEEKVPSDGSDKLEIKLTTPGK
jgi:hypothetical protein